MYLVYHQESEKTSASIFWNVWVMLSMPAVWLGWCVFFAQYIHRDSWYDRSMIFYIICIMAFVWQTGTVSQPRDYFSRDLEILIPRIVISCVLALGFVYLTLVVATFSRYSDPMEQAWQARIREWLAEKAVTINAYHGPPSYPQGHRIGSPQRGGPSRPNPERSSGYPSHAPLHNTRPRNDDGYKAPRPMPIGQGTPFPRGDNDVHIQPRSKPTPQAATKSRSIPLSQSGIGKAGATFEEVLNANFEALQKGPPMIPESVSNAYYATSRTPGTPQREGGSVSTVQSTRTPPPDTIERRDHESALHTSGRFGQESAEHATKNPPHVDVPDSEHPRRFRSANQKQTSENCVANVVAVPLEGASTVDGKRSALGEMQEAGEFDVRVANLRDMEEYVPGEVFVEPAASNSPVRGNIPLPWDLAETGLASSSRERS